MATEILTAADTTLTALSALFSTFTPEEVNQLPFEGSWTAGQLATHLIKSNGGFVEIMNGPVKETDRAPDMLVAGIKKDFLDFSTKMISPPFIAPENIPYQKEALLSAMKKIKNDLSQAIQALDLSKTCLAFELPGYGAFTRLEAASFIVYHTQRHLRQLKNIRDKVGKEV